MFRLHILGDPVLLDAAGQAVAGRAAYRRRIALLAVLAVSRGRPVGRERLIGLLWPDRPGDAARRTLSESLYVLRRELGGEVFDTPGDEVALNRQVLGCDAAEFLDALDDGDAEAAVALYGGPLLDGFHVDDAPEWERWVDAERARLAEAYAGALEGLARRDDAAGRTLAAVDGWRRLAAHDPFSGRVAAGLMRALAAAGDPAAALRAAGVHAALLREELQLEPGEEVRALVDQLRAPPAASPAPPDPPDSVDSVDSGDPVDPVDPVEAGGPVREEKGETPGPDERAPVPERRGWGKRSRTAGAAAALVAALVAGVWMGDGGDSAGEVDAASLDPARIAVLYLDDHSPGGELRHVAAGLTEMLIHELSGVPALDVVSRNGVKPFRDGTTPLDSIVAALRVGSVVEGSVRPRGDSVRVVVQLIDAATGGHLASRAVTRAAGPAAEDALAAELAAFVRSRVGTAVHMRRIRAETRSARAHTLLLRASRLHDGALTLRSAADPRDRASFLRLLDEADTALVRARRADPGWARPAVMRARVALTRADAAPAADRPALLRVAWQAAERAVALAPDGAGAREVRGLVRWRQAAGHTHGDSAPVALHEARRDLQAAVDAEPGRARAWAALSQVLRFSGALAEANLAARRAVAADAWLTEADEVVHRLFADALARGDHPAARASCAQGARLFSRDWRFVECGLTLMRVDTTRAPDPDAAWRLVDRLGRLDPPAAAAAEGRRYSPLYRRAVVAAVLARAGAADSARAVIDHVVRDARDDAESRVSAAYDRAWVRALLGDRAGARRDVDAYLAARPALRGYLLRDPMVKQVLAGTSGQVTPPPP